MTLHIIHLPHRTDRWKTLTQELKDQSIIDYRVWHGVEDPEQPYRGIAKAHKQIIQYAKDNNLESILIAEDDVRFTASKALLYFLSKEPSTYDLYLGGISSGRLNPDQTVTNFSGLMLYKMRQQFYDTFLSLTEDSHIDRTLKNKGIYIVCNPFIAIQHNGYSDNKKIIVNYDRYFSNRELYQTQ